ncbi:MAG: hypothetical protein, partial [Olavius algarvensis spirochete endosymbiont]
YMLSGWRIQGCRMKCIFLLKKNQKYGTSGLKKT